ncbi:MAG: serine--tRNA ligase [Rhizobiales bacterium]|nr:serine--tRNA ligase [Hyphomicrobiales bacterium]MBI3673525.1 serine--tRNA ligase [Hyphomicrobiales bacterium]
MHDIKAIRDNPEAFDRGLARRGLPPMAAQILRLDHELREHTQRLQATQAQANSEAKAVGTAVRSGDSSLIEAAKAKVTSIKRSILSGEQIERDLRKRLNDALAVIPNIPLDEVPDGKDELANVEVRRWGEPPTFAFKARQHFDIGEWLGLMDFEAATKLSGARFVVLKGALARLERSLAQLMLDHQTQVNGYTEHYVPLMVRDHVMYGTAQLPKFRDDQFIVTSMAVRQQLLEQALATASEQQLTDFRNGAIGQVEFVRRVLEDAPSKEDYWLIPTAEVSLTNLVREKVLDEKDLPLRLTAYTPCFRAEAGAAGRDTRGMIRQHQFTKVELVSITTPEQSRDELDRMTACAESVLQKLGLAYRVVRLCTGDMGFGSRMTYDIEVWLPGQNTYREISSCSVCGDFQARRMEARYKPADGKGTRYVHTLNGSGLAVGRTLIAVLENYQNADGTVTIPEVLRAYMGGQDRITRP